eukprot:gene12530-12619_t
MICTEIEICDVVVIIRIAKSKRFGSASIADLLLDLAMGYGGTPVEVYNFAYDLKIFTTLNRWRGARSLSMFRSYRSDTCRTGETGTGQTNPGRAPMKLLVADDHALLRQGLLVSLGDAHPDWQFAEAAGLDQALEILSGNTIDMAIIDLNMPGMEGGASLQALREGYPDVRIAVLTATEDRATILECLAAGAHGYILKSDAVEQLVFAIETVLRGQVYVPPALARVVQGAQRTNPLPAAATPVPEPEIAQPPARIAGFTPRQADVLKLLAEGRSTKDIARRLALGVGTVKVHLAGVYRVLGARNRMEAVVKAGKVRLET